MAEPSDGIVDAHHHIWRLSDLPWLAGPIQPRIFGDYRAMQRDYLIEDYLADAKPAGVTRSVYVQTNWPPGRALAEVEWVQSVADKHGWPHAIVGGADFSDPDTAAVIAAQAKHPLLRGLRQQMHWHENPTYRFASRPDAFDDPTWRSGLALLEKHGLLFELQVFSSQMKGAAKLVKDFPGLQFVLIHAGMLEDTSPDGWKAWREGMAQLAQARNLAVKLSGLGTFVRRLDPELSIEISRQTVAMFGAQRVMWGSNFPVEKLWTDYASLVRVLKDALAPLPPADRQAILHGTATRLYRL
ncbi:MAG TPA: amidohydrolase family protein [Xanthobacteraceae bacterium]|nr:amidohydrolase family protein [Xanthobacteraceae bacterium]